jgi:hypothetical protein
MIRVRARGAEPFWERTTAAILVVSPVAEQFYEIAAISA